jgi:hypothetical protein
MNKIPVRETIAYAYSFTFSQLGSIIGLAWISLVAIAILQFLPYAAGGDPTAAETSPMVAGQHAIQNLGISLLVLLLTAIIYVAVTRLALGTRPGGAIAHFALGVPEFRTFGAIFLFGVVIFAIAIAFGIGIAIMAGVASASHNEAVLALVIVLLLLAMMGAVIYITARLGFLLVPATVVEEQISLSRGWILTQGNFWRIVAVVLAVLAPIALLEMAGFAAIMGPGLFAALPAGTPEAASAALQMRFAEVGRHVPALIGLRLLIAPFQLGLSMGASAFAYRALTAPAPQ